MTKENFKAAGLQATWAAANGSKEWPFGDNWRLALVNPVVLHAANLVQAGFDPRKPTSLYREMARQRESFPGVLDTPSVATVKTLLENWHKRPFVSTDSSRQLDKLRILDLGCGEAYRSRWLASFGCNYLGVDGEEGLIDLAEKRRGEALALEEAPEHLTGHEYKVRDLENENLDLAELCGDFAPNLALAITIFDHLKDPRPFLKRLSNFLAAAEGGAPLLAITLNPRHFDKKLGTMPFCTLDNPGANPASKKKVFGTLATSAIESARLLGASVRDAPKASAGMQTADVYFRSLRDWEEAFSREFQVLRASPLQFGDFTVLAALGGNLEGASVFYAEPPFNAWLLYPRKVPRLATTSEVDALPTLPGFFPGAWNSVIEKLKAQEPVDLKVCNFRPNERILFPQNLGGEVCAVLEGSAYLTTADGSHMAPAFRPGDLLGELEAELHSEKAGGEDEGDRERQRKHLIRRYPYPVDAGDEGATLLQFSNKAFTEVAQLSGRFAGYLFQDLRDKLLVNAFTLFGERARSEDVRWENATAVHRHRVGKFKSAELQDFAKALMSLSSIESYDSIRNTDGTTLFLGVVELAHLMDATVEDVSEMLKLYHQLRLITWYPGLLYQSSGPNDHSGILVEVAGRDKAEDIWKVWKQVAFEGLVVERLVLVQPEGTKDAEKLLSAYKKEVLGKYKEFDSHPSIQNLCIEKQGLTKISKSCLESYRGLVGPENRACIDRWFANIAYVNDFIVHARGGRQKRNPRIIQIDAVDDLRRLALDESEFRRVFFDRLQVFRDGEEHADLQRMRKRKYCEAVEEFLKSVWRSGQDCCMTGSTRLSNLQAWNDVSDYERVITKS